MLRLFSWIAYRHLKGQLGRSFISVLGIALGVAVFVAIRLASGSAVASFNDSVDALAGPANLQVSSGASGLHEEKFAAVTRIPGVKATFPAVQALTVTSDPPGRTLLVVGLDFFSDPRVAAAASEEQVNPGILIDFLVKPDSLAVTRRFAERAGWKLGDRVGLSYAGRRFEMEVRLLLGGQGLGRAYGGDIAIVDIAAAQENLGKLGALDRIDLKVQEGKAFQEASRAIQELYPAAVVERPAARGSQVEAMISSFRLNLLALSLVALFVGAFLIFNTISLSVIQRRREIGIARSVGVSRGQILGLFLAEAAIYGTFGSGLGLVLGIGLGYLAVGSVSGTISSLYALVKTSGIVIDTATLAIGATLGLLAALASGLTPALEASLTRPGVASREGSITTRRTGALVGLTLLAVACAGASYLFARIALQDGNGTLGFASAAFVMMASALFAPVLTLGLCRLAAPVARGFGGVVGLLASRWVERSLERTSVVIAALAASVTMLVALNIMVGSFRQTVEIWMNQTVQADIFVQPASTAITGQYSDLPEGVVEVMRRQPGVMALDTLRANTVLVDGNPVEMFAFDFTITRQNSRLVFLEGDASQIMQRAENPESVLVSETFLARFGKGKGDSIRLNTPRGERDFRIEGVFYDYTSERGLVVIHSRNYAEIWRDPVHHSAAIYLNDGVDVTEAMERLKKDLAGRYEVVVIDNRELKDRALKVFDQTFAITNALKVVAVLIAVMGVITTMAALILQRQREIGVLRSVGASRTQIGRMAIVESGLIGFFGTVIGCMAGPFVALVLIKVINRLFFGWTIVPVYRPEWFFEAVAWVVGASLLAGLAPARSAMRLEPAEAVRDE